MRPESRRGGFMSLDEVSFYIIILALCLVLAIFFPVYKSSRDAAHRREQAAGLRRSLRLQVLGELP